MGKIEFVPLNLPKPLVEELKIWKRAYCNAYNKQVSYGEMFRGMLDSMSEIDPCVVEELDLMVKQHPELMESLANNRSLPGQDARENND